MRVYINLKYKIEGGGGWTWRQMWKVMFCFDEAVKLCMEVAKQLMTTEVEVI